NVTHAQPGSLINTLEFKQASDGTVNGEITLNDGQVEALRNNEFYIQIHSESNPPGELRGWVYLRSHFNN
ncbi:MAG: CHRD domain-containing protein, partial [Gammaproteobacteria bacterium]|nr:CHRD domain-containing protein [Gammaproteobacteria bacterium]